MKASIFMKLMETYVSELGDFELTLDGEHPLNLIVPHSIGVSPFLTTSKKNYGRRLFAYAAQDSFEIWNVGFVEISPDNSAEYYCWQYGDSYSFERLKKEIENEHDDYDEVYVF